MSALEYARTTPESLAGAYVANVKKPAPLLASGYEPEVETDTDDITASRDPIV